MMENKSQEEIKEETIFDTSVMGLWEARQQDIYCSDELICSDYTIILS